MSPSTIIMLNTTRHTIAAIKLYRQLCSLTRSVTPLATIPYSSHGFHSTSRVSLHTATHTSHTRHADTEAQEEMEDAVDGSELFDNSSLPSSLSCAPSSSQLPAIRARFLLLNHHRLWDKMIEYFAELKKQRCYQHVVSIISYADVFLICQFTVYSLCGMCDCPSISSIGCCMLVSE